MDKEPEETGHEGLAAASFDERLRRLIGKQSISSFARKVGLGESLIRKYLAGSEPSLSKAEQIAKHTQVTLQWLATGSGQPDRYTDQVDMPAMELATELVRDQFIESSGWSEVGKNKVLYLLYQYLIQTRDNQGALNVVAGQLYLAQLMLNQRMKDSG